MKKVASFSPSDYETEIANTDVLNSNDINPVLQGLYGEVGGIMSTAKKHVREGDAYPGYRRAAEEEFGDTLWYLAALCRRMNITLESVFVEAANHSQSLVPESSIDTTLIDLGQAAAALLGKYPPDRAQVILFAKCYLEALSAVQLPFSEVARNNLKKAQGAFLEPETVDLIDFDLGFKEEEQLPRDFRILVSQRASGKTYLQWNNVFIGDPLSDNISDPDGYRFHDVFHFSYAAILHWSPVTRALIKQKRKSRPKYDEEQDNGRAIVVEEGLSAWIFSRAKELHFFEGQKKVSFGILKTIGEFVRGYEVDQCPLKLWERAILDGYAVFRQIRDNEGGWIIGNRAERTIKYFPADSEK